MKKYNSLVLCEGETDQALIGSYLEATNGWSFLELNKGFPFQSEMITKYQRNDGRTLGIWPIGGNDFNKTVTKILEGEKKDKIVDKVIVITDHDDSDSEQNHPNKPDLHNPENHSSLYQ